MADTLTRTGAAEKGVYRGRWRPLVAAGSSARNHTMTFQGHKTVAPFGLDESQYAFCVSWFLFVKSFFTREYEKKTIIVPHTVCAETSVDILFKVDIP